MRLTQILTYFAGALALSAQLRVIPAPTQFEPYAPLSGGAFSGAPLKFHPDPLGTYVWAAGVDASKLQIFSLLPEAVSLTPGSAMNAFTNASSLLAPAPSVLVSGFGGLFFDFGCETAAWIEFESGDLGAADAATITLSVSEYNEYGSTNLGAKTGVPIAHPKNDGSNVTMYRLELPHPDLFEGVRFAWLRVNATPATPWHITAVRLVAQIKPTNWGGAFASPGDDNLSRLWYLGAYTVKVNLLSDQFGSILVYRGDRYSWTGDAHVAQATAMSALGNFDFVAQNLLFTQNNCNGIESYCLYLILSATDYYTATGDVATINALAAALVPKLEHAHAVWGSQVQLGFYGWDDRTGCGFAGSGTTFEAQAAYRFLAIRAWRAWAGMLNAMGNVTDSAHFNEYADAAVNATRALAHPGEDWYTPLGLFAAADALNAGFVTPSEAAVLVSSHFNDSTAICGLSPFNTYFVLSALSVAGDLDRGLATIHACWDVMLRLGATTTWEIAKPGWADFTELNGAVAGFQGWTSMAHPWSSGHTSWISAQLAGVRSTTPGFATFDIAPHIAGTMGGVAATVPLSDGQQIVLRAAKAKASANASAYICVASPRSSRVGTLHISHLLAARLSERGTGSATVTMFTTDIFFTERGSCACEGDTDAAGVAGARTGEVRLTTATPLIFTAASKILDPATGFFSQEALFHLSAGGCTRLVLSATADVKPDAALPIGELKRAMGRFCYLLTPPPPQHRIPSPHLSTLRHLSGAIARPPVRGSERTARQGTI